MTLTFRSWLPPGATAPRAAVAAIGDVVEAWSLEWFAETSMRAAAGFVRIAEPRGELRKLRRHVRDGGLAIAVGQGGVPALGALVLAVPFGGIQRRAADLELLDNVGAECLDVLKQRLSTLFELGRDATWSQSDGGRDAGAAYRLEISAANRGTVLTLELTEDVFARFVKARLPAPPAPAPLPAPDAGLAQLPVQLSAVLGKCSVSVAELSGLAAGDVLVLDRMLDAPLSLALGHVPLARGACTVAHRAPGLALELTQSPIG